jgi:hypothetical protein
VVSVALSPTLQLVAVALVAAAVFVVAVVELVEPVAVLALAVGIAVWPQLVVVVVAGVAVAPLQVARFGDSAFAVAPFDSVGLSYYLPVLRHSPAALPAAGLTSVDANLRKQ